MLRRFYAIPLLILGLFPVNLCMAEEETFPAKLITNFPHAHNVYSVAISPSKTILTCGMENGEIELWNLRNFKPVTTFKAYDGSPVDILEFLPDGKLVSVSSKNGKIIIWDLTTYKAIRSFEHERAVYDIDFSSDYKLMVSSGESPVKIWDISSGSLIASFPGEAPARISPGNSLLAVRSGDNIRLYDMETKLAYKLIKRVKLPTGGEAISPIFDFSPNSGMIIAIYRDSSKYRYSSYRWVMFFNTLGDLANKNSLAGNYGANTDRKHNFMISPNHKIAAIIGNDKILILNLITQKLSSFDGVVNHLSFSWDGEWMATCSGTMAYLWEMPPIVDEEPVKGDLNGDGLIKSIDAAIALRIAAGLILPTDEQRIAGDMNGDGKIKSVDAYLILKKAAGLGAPMVSPLPVSLRTAEKFEGDTLLFTLSIDGISNVACGDFELSYDPLKLRPIQVLRKRQNDMFASNTDQSGVVKISWVKRGGEVSSSVADVVFQILDNSQSSPALRAELFDLRAIPMNVRIVGWNPTPARFELLQNYPNPFNPETWIPFRLAKPADVTLRIYDVKGGLIRMIRLGRLDAGEYVTPDKAAHWDGRNDKGEEVSSGVYIYELRAGKIRAMRRMVLEK